MRIIAQNFVEELDDKRITQKKGGEEGKLIGNQKDEIKKVEKRI